MARPQDEALLGQGEDENAGGAEIWAVQACVSLSTEGNKTGNAPTHSSDLL